MWTEWQRTWTECEVPNYRPGNPEAFLILDRTTRIIGFSRQWVTGPPPPGLSRAVPLLDTLSRAVQRLSAQSAWCFESTKQADEVADGLLKVAQDLEDTHYLKILPERLETLRRQVTMATRRLDYVNGREEGRLNRSCDQVRRKASQTDEPKWLTVTEAAKLLFGDIDGLTLGGARARVSKAATAGKFGTNGETGPSRRIESHTFDSWRLKQRERDLDRA